MNRSVNEFDPERRLNRRVAAHLQVSVLGTDRSGKRIEVIANTANLSHGGMAITSRTPFEVGAEVDLRVRAESTTGNRDEATLTHGRILDVHWREDIQQFIIRIQYEAEEFTIPASANTKDKSVLNQSDLIRVKSGSR